MSHSKKIEETKVGWTETVVMVCTKCGKQFEDPSSQEAPERIKSELKSMAKSELDKERVRVITTSCLNICPVNKIAIAVASSKDAHTFSAYNVDPDTSALDIFKTIF